MISDPAALAVYAAFGLLYGIVLQRSGFCFARAALELFLLRSRDALNGVLAGLAAGTIGFAAVTAVRAHLGLTTSDHLLVLPLGLGTFIGAAMFGLGMSLAGMCIVGSLLRLGEGYLIGALALLGAVVGAALDPFRAVLGRSALLPNLLGTPVSGASVADWLGLPGAVLLTLAALALVARVGNPRSRRPSLRLQLTPAVIGGVLLAALNTAQMAWHQPWTVAYPLGVVATAASGTAGFSLHHAMPLLTLDLGVVLGAAGSALAARDLRLRWPRQRGQVALSLGGGVLMGWGVQLAHGCNIGGLLSALPSLSLSAWLFLPGLFAGAWLGSLILRRVS
jgi:hypothetical protein